MRLKIDNIINNGLKSNEGKKRKGHDQYLILALNIFSLVIPIIVCTIAIGFFFFPVEVYYYDKRLPKWFSQNIDVVLYLLTSTLIFFTIKNEKYTTAKYIALLGWSISILATDITVPYFEKVNILYFILVVGTAFLFEGLFRRVFGFIVCISFFTIASLNYFPFYDPEATYDVADMPTFYSEFTFICLTYLIISIISVKINRYEVEITDQKNKLKRNKEKLTEEIRKVKNIENERDVYFSNIVHELRTPLTVITGISNELLQEKIYSEHFKKVNLLRRNVLDLESITNQVLGLVKKDGNTLKPDIESFKFTEIDSSPFFDNNSLTIKKSVVASSVLPISTTTNETKTVLIVEDNLSLIEYYDMILKNEYSLVFANNGQEALVYMEKNIPDLIISDLMMSVMGGMTFLSILKNTSTYSKIPIIIVTAKVELSERIKALKIGVDSFLLKPFNKETLIAKINSLLDFNQNRIINEKELGKGKRKISLFSRRDQKWIEEFEKKIENIYFDVHVNVDRIAEEMSTSKANLHRKVTRIVGVSPKKYLQEVRLLKSLELFSSGDYDSVKSVAYSCGFKSEKVFSRNFKARFGKSPREYLR